MMNSSLLQSIDITSSSSSSSFKNADRAALSQSLLGDDNNNNNNNNNNNEQDFFLLPVEEQIAFVDEGQVFVPNNSNNNNNNNNNNIDLEQQEGRRNSGHWRDAWAAVLFLLHQGVIFYLAFAWGIPSLNYSYDTTNYDTNDSNNNNGGNDGSQGHRYLQQELQQQQQQQQDEESYQVHLGGFVLLCFLSSLAALLISASAISIMIRFAQKTIQFSLIFAILANIVVIFWSFSALLGGQQLLNPQRWIGLCLATVCLIWVVAYTRAVWHRVPFASANLVTALTAVQTNGGIVGVSMAATLAMSLWTVTIWVLALIGVYMRHASCRQEEEDGSSRSCETHTNAFFFILLFLSYYWTLEVFKNVMHVTTAGTVGTWWFAPDDACTYCSPAITDSLRRATTYSLGSICFGSLLTALLQLLHQMCHELRRRMGRGHGTAACNATLLLVVEFLLHILDNLVHYFNKWAYVYIGLYGYDYLTSGQKVFVLFRERGWTTIINDHLVTRALSLVSFVIGALTGVIGLALYSAKSTWMNDFSDSGAVVLAFSVPFSCGLALSFVLLSVVASAVDTVVVCFAEAPLEFERNHPGLYTQMTHAWRLAYPNEFRQ